MYEIHWGIDGRPFRPHHGSPFVRQNDGHDEVQARMEFLVLGRRRLGLMVGEPGSGKSLQFEAFADRMTRDGARVAHLSLIGLDASDTLREILTTLGLHPTDGWSFARLWRALLDHITVCRYEHRQCVLLLDDFDRTDHGVRDLVHRLLQSIDAGPSNALTVILGAHPETLHRVGRRLLDLVELRIDLETWTVEETEEHLQSAMSTAGRDEPVFQRDAIVRLHQLGHGVPRHINQLADLALVAGAGRGVQQIDRDTVDSVYNELGTIDP